MELEELYQELIIDHGTNPRNHKALDKYSHKAKGLNPVCGDKLDIFLLIKEDEIVDVGFTGQGCAISMASASILTETLKGMQINDAIVIFEEFKMSMTSDNIKSEIENNLKLQALSGVKNYPSRVKCATLAWHAMFQAINNKNAACTE